MMSKPDPPPQDLAPGIGGEGRKPYLFLILILLLAIAARAWPLTSPRLRSDSGEYLDLAREMARGEYFKKDYSLSEGILWSRRLVPAYSLLVAGVHRLGLPLEASGYAVSLLADLLAVVVAFRIGWRLCGSRGGLLAGLLVASSLHHLVWSTEVLTESLFGLLLLLVIALALAIGRHPRPLLAAGLGVCSALLYLTREIGFACLLILGLTSLCWLLLPGRPDPKKFAGVAIAFLTAYVLVALPFWLMVRVRTGEWSLSMRGKVVSTMLAEKGAQPYATTPEPTVHSSHFLPALKRRISLADDYLRKMLPMGPSSYLKWLGLIWFLVFGGQNRRLSLLLLSWAALWFLANIAVGPVKIVVRYNFPTWVFLELAMALAWAQLPRWLSERFLSARPRLSHRFASILTTLIVLVFLSDAFLGATYLKAARQMEGPFIYSAGIHEISQEIAKRYPLPLSPRVMDRKPYAAYYLDATMLMLPDTLPELELFTAGGQVDVLIIDSVLIRQTKPQLASLISGRHPPFGMRVLFQKFVPRLVKIYTIYVPDHGEKIEPPPEISLKSMETALSQGELWTARQIGEALLAHDPQNYEAHRLMANLEMIVAGMDLVSLPYAEAQVALLSRLQPHAPATLAAQQNLAKLKTQLSRFRLSSPPPETEDLLENPLP